MQMKTVVIGEPSGVSMEEIMKVYPDGDAWKMVLQEENVPYMTAFVKEALRFWSNVPLSFPRQSVRPIEYQGATIPEGTTFILVRYVHSCEQH